MIIRKKLNQLGGFFYKRLTKKNQTEPSVLSHTNTVAGEGEVFVTSNNQSSEVQEASTQDILQDLDYDSLQGLVFSYLYLVERLIQHNGINEYEKEAFESISKKLKQLQIKLPDSDNYAPITKRSVLGIIAAINTLNNKSRSDIDRENYAKFLKDLGFEELLVQVIVKSVKEQSRDHYLAIMRQHNPKAKTARFVYLSIKIRENEESAEIYDGAIKTIQAIINGSKDVILKYDDGKDFDGEEVFYIKTGDAVAWSEESACPIMDTKDGISLYFSYIPLSNSGYIPVQLVAGLFYIQSWLQKRKDRLKGAEVEKKPTDATSELEIGKASIGLLRENEQAFVSGSHPSSKKKGLSVNPLIDIAMDEETKQETLVQTLHRFNNKNSFNTEEQAGATGNNLPLRLFSDNGWSLLILK